MADGAIYYFGAQRNEDYYRSWEFRAGDDEEFIDISSWSFKLRIKSAAGNSDPPLLEVTHSPTGNGSVLTPSDGQLAILLKQEDIALLPGRTSDIVPFAYNLIAIDTAGIRRADVRGAFIVEPGV